MIIKLASSIFVSFFLSAISTAQVSDYSPDKYEVSREVSSDGIIFKHYEANINSRIYRFTPVLSYGEPGDVRGAHGLIEIETEYGSEVLKLAGIHISPPGCSTMEGLTVFREGKPRDMNVRGSRAVPALIAYCGTQNGSSNYLVLISGASILTMKSFGRFVVDVEFLESPDRFVAKTHSVISPNIGTGRASILRVEEMIVQPVYQQFNHRNFNRVYAEYSEIYKAEYFRLLAVAKTKSDKNDVNVAAMIAALRGVNDIEFACEALTESPFLMFNKDQLLEEFSSGQYGGFPGLDINSCG